MTEARAMPPILIVEDNPEDYETLVRGMRKIGATPEVRHCWSGDKALDYLFRRGEYKDPETSPRPGIVLLDLNLPGTDGREVLDQIKSDPDLKVIPVIVLTSSMNASDITECYASGANSYVAEPIGVDSFVGTLRQIRDYWFRVVTLPGDARAYGGRR